MQVEIDKGDAKLSDLLAAARRGEEVVLTEDDKPIARLIPIRSGFRFGGFEGKLGEIPDLLEPLPEDEVRLWEGGA